MCIRDSHSSAQLTPSDERLGFLSPPSVAKPIKELQGQKVPGHDGITGRNLKEMLKKGVIMIKLNASLRLKCFSKDWNEAVTVLHHKKMKANIQV